MDIKVLGRGCAKCHRLEELTREAIVELAVEATFSKLTEMDDILAYDIMSTPGLVIDGVVKSSGRVPRKEEIMAWIQDGEEA
jgi:small redox-active disulfide protein 2